MGNHPQNDLPEPSVPENDSPDLPESDLDIPDDPILDFVNSQCHSSEDLDQAFQAYQAYQVPCPQDSTMIAERTANHHLTYHVAQASQPKHGSLVDRGPNRGLAGSDERILSRSSRKYTVTGIDSHELQGLDVVRCAALVETNHGRLLCLIYVCYLLNHIACTTLDGKISLLGLTGITSDISIILLFTFYQPVFYATYDQNFPSESEERAGYLVGFGEHCGDAMTHIILDHDTQKIIYRSAVRPKKSSTPNHRLAPHGWEVSPSSDPSEDKTSS